MDTETVDLVGYVTEDTGAMPTTRRLLVRAGNQTWRVEVPESATVLNVRNERTSIHRIGEGSWVHVRGMVTGGQRLRAMRVHEIGTAAQGVAAYRQSAYYRPGFEQGYVVRVAGVREEVMPPAAIPPGPFTGAVPVEIVGRVTEDTGALEATRRILVRAGDQVWRLDVVEEARVLSAAGEPISIHEIDEGSWIHARGWRSGEQRARVTELHQIATEEQGIAGYRQSPFYRAGFEQGYVMQVAGVRELFQPIQLTGTVVRVNRADEWFVLRTDDGREITVYVEGARFFRGGQPFEFAALRPGDRVTVSGRTVGGFMPAAAPMGRPQGPAPMPARPDY